MEGWENPRITFVLVLVVERDGVMECWSDASGCTPILEVEDENEDDDEGSHALLHYSTTPSLHSGPVDSNVTKFADSGQAGL